jgi:predicted AAA+ superfamily ATPase
MIKDIFELQNPWRTSKMVPKDLRHRTLLDILINNLDNKKILGLIGSRQVGKSSLLYLLIAHLIGSGVETSSIYYFNLDDLKLHELFDNLSDFTHFIGKGREKCFVIIDEVQRLQNPGLFLKSLYDLNRNIKIIYSGSSQLEMKSKLKEHLVGRARQFEIQRLSFSEYLKFNRPIPHKQALSEMLIYGSYPEVALERHTTEKKLLLKDIYQSYVEKDLVDFLKVRSVEAFNKLIILLANQIGNLLNIDALARTLRISRKEVEKYLFILENTFIIKRVYPFHKNYKKEITKTPKLYFMDIGLRNFVINSFNELSLRNDQGLLFENFYMLELLSKDPHALQKINFWRTTNQTEIDFILTQGNDLKAIEVKWNKATPPKSFKTLRKYYPGIQTELVSRHRYQ